MTSSITKINKEENTTTVEKNGCFLSDKARKELRTILQKEIGVEKTEMFEEKDLDHVGQFFLSIFAESLKMENNKEGI